MIQKEEEETQYHYGNEYSEVVEKLRYPGKTKNEARTR